MIEPTETESKETLDAFCDAVIQIAQEARENPELLKTALHTALVDEVRAAKELQLGYAPGVPIDISAPARAWTLLSEKRDPVCRRSLVPLFPLTEYSWRVV